MNTRWAQRFQNFEKSFLQLEIDLKNPNPNRLEKQGLIKAFEYTYELSWNVVKDYLEFQGFTDLVGARDTYTLAFNRGLIENGPEWLDMIKHRNLTTHTYDERTAERVYLALKTNYLPLFKSIYKKFKLLTEVT